MSGFNCVLCKENKDEVTHNFLNGHSTCDECWAKYVNKRTPSAKERLEVADLYGGSME